MGCIPIQGKGSYRIRVGGATKFRHGLRQVFCIFRVQSRRFIRMSRISSIYRSSIVLQQCLSLLHLMQLFNFIVNRSILITWRIQVYSTTILTCQRRHNNNTATAFL